MAELKQARVLLMGDKMRELPVLERARYVFARSSSFVCHFGDQSRFKYDSKVVPLFCLAIGFWILARQY